MNAEEVIARMLDVYASAATYRDTGTAVTRWTFLGRAPREVRCDSATAFARPNRLRVNSWHWFNARRAIRQVVWCEPVGANLWRPYSGAQGPKPLAHALLTSLDLSQRLAFAVLAALARDQLGSSALETLSNLCALQELSPVEFEGRLCHRLRARCSHWPGCATAECETIAEALARLRELSGREVPNEPARYFPLELWIDAGTFLMRRLSHTILEANRATEMDVRFDPELNAPVAEGELTFDPAVSGAAELDE